MLLLYCYLYAICNHKPINSINYNNFMISFQYFKISERIKKYVIVLSMIFPVVLSLIDIYITQESNIHQRFSFY